ncbi:ABC transporter permease [Paenibacillus sp. HJGM_3]|uniref:ABC transporter permease n=1 Tax=Paenibacillus sp. HJGM_3 TaxID=3379816 RepID=UPI00385EF345
MSVYWTFVVKSFQQRFVYRINSYITILSAWLGLFVLVSAWRALYSGKTAVNGITFEDMINFIVINTLVASLIHSNMGQKIGERVADGSISIDLIRPITFKGYYLANQLGENAFALLFSTMPATLLAVLLWGFHFPDNPLRVALFLVSLMLGLLVMNQINYLFGLLAIWLKTSWFINAITGAAFELFAGTFVPLWFYPEWLYTVAKCLPFHLVTFQPISIFLGRLSIPQSWGVLGLQLLWLAALWGLEQWMWSKSQDEIDIHGG